MADFTQSGFDDDPKDKIRREAEMHELELDTIREVPNEGVGTTYRVLETDADDEANQVGFEITHPGGPAGDMMFSSKLGNSMRALRRYIDGEDPNEPEDDLEYEPEPDPEPRPDDAPAPSASTSAGSETELPRSTVDPYTGTVVSGRSTSGEAEPARQVAPAVGITVEFTEEQTAEITEAFEEAVQERDEQIDELEQRIERLESALSVFADFSREDEE